MKLPILASAFWVVASTGCSTATYESNIVPGHPAFADDSTSYTPPPNPFAAPPRASAAPAAMSPHVQHPPTTQPQSTITATWTCPMHPEVESDQPGECPVCEMDVVPRIAPTDRPGAMPRAHEDTHGGGR